MCKTSAMMWALPAMPMLAMMKMAGQSGSCDKARDTENTNCGAPDKRPTRPARKTIVDTAQSAGSFSKLIDLLGRADLVSALQADGPLTVFAPTDEAVAKLPAKAIERLKADPVGLAAVLKNHVVPGRLGAAELAGVDRVRTLQGESLPVDTTMGVRVGSSYVIRPDIECSNGIVHAIDSVILLD